MPHTHETDFRRLIDNLPDIVYRFSLVDPVGFLFINSIVTKVTGYTPEDHYNDPALGQKIVHPEDLHLLTDLTQRPWDGPRAARIRWITKAGKTIWTEQHITPVLDENNQIQYIDGVARDITAQVIAEQENLRLASVVRQAGETIVITDLDGSILYANPVIEKVTGYKINELLGKNPRVLKSGHQSPEVYKQLWETITSGNIWQGELVNRRKDGNLFTEQATIFPILDDASELYNFAAVKRDITSYKQQIRQMEVISELSSSMRSATTLGDLSNIMLLRLQSLLALQSGMVMLHRPATGQFYIQRATGIWSHLTGQRIPDSDNLSQQVIDSRHPVLISNLENASDVTLRGLIVDPAAALGLPLIIEDQVIGVLWVSRKHLPYQEQVFPEFDTNLLKLAAELAGSALNRIQLHNHLEQHIEQLHLANQIAINLSMILERNELYAQLSGAIHGLLADTSLIEIYSLDPVQQRALCIFATDGQTTRQASLSEPLHSLSSATFSRVNLRRRALIINNPGTRQQTEQNLPGIGKLACELHAPLIINGRITGVLRIGSQIVQRYSEDETELIQMLASATSAAMHTQDALMQIKAAHQALSESYNITLEGWVRTLAIRDEGTNGHSRRVTDRCVKLAQYLGYNGEALEEVRRGALLHDIGKIGIPDRILHKPGPLEDDEWAVMRTHPRLAFDLLNPIPHLRDAMDIPLYHHEKWDGSGYPFGLKGEDIPLPARIFAIIDVWDALTSPRPYRPAWSEAETLRYIFEQRGKHFDPAIVEAFLNVFHKQPQDSGATLSGSH